MPILPLAAVLLSAPPPVQAPPSALDLAPIRERAPAQEPAPVPEAPDPEAPDPIEAAVRAFLEETQALGCIVGTLKDGRRTFHGGGRVRPDSDAAPTGRTVYEIGSITKTLTGVLLALAVERGEVELEAPVARYLPEEVEMPELDGEPIRLVHLATHTSGLPRMPPGFAPANWRDPYADYGTAQLYASLARTELTRAPGARNEYSNYGTGLLGHVLELTGGASFEELVLERIARPLGMTDTALHLSEEQAERLAPGCSAAGDPLANWDFDALAAAGAVRSSARDMLIYAQANLDARGGGEEPAEAEGRGELDRALRASHELHHRFPGGRGGIGLGWHWSSDGSRLWHNGGTGGYATMLMLEPEHGAAVVVLCNTPTRKVDELGDRVMKLLVRGDR